MSSNATGVWGWQRSQPLLGLRKEHLPLGSAEGPFTTGTLAARWKKHLAKARGGSRRKSGRCLLQDLGLDGWGKAGPPERGWSHQGSAQMLAQGWISKVHKAVGWNSGLPGSQSGGRRHFSCCCCAWAHWGSWWGRTFQKKNYSRTLNIRHSRCFHGSIT